MAQKFRTLQPFTVLCYLSLVNLLNYFDRGAVAGILTSIEQEFELSNTSDGLLAGSFMVGFMVTNPIFAHLSHKYHPTTLMFGGLLVWSVATIVSGFSNSFLMLAICRMITGAGEASFAGLAPTYIDDNAPIESRTKWLSLFYTAIPFGGALGYIASGLVADYWNWRGIFYIEGFFMLPLAFVCICLPTSIVPGTAKSYFNFELGSKENESTASMPSMTTHSNVGRDVTDVDLSVSTSIWVLFHSPNYIATVLGYASYTFVIGAFAFWCPSFLEENFKLSKSEANTTFGMVTAFSGIFGTSFGGWFLDRNLKSLVGSDGDSSRIGLKLSIVAVSLALPLTACSFFVPDPFLYFTIMAISEFMLFSVTGPINGALLSSVPLWLRSFAMATCNLTIHLIGDLPSPILVGYVSDILRDKTMSLALCSLWNVWTIVFWLVALRLSRRPSRRRANSDDFENIRLIGTASSSH